MCATVCGAAAEQAQPLLARVSGTAVTCCWWSGCTHAVPGAAASVGSAAAHGLLAALAAPGGMMHTSAQLQAAWGGLLHSLPKMGLGFGSLLLVSYVCALVLSQISHPSYAPHIC